MADADHAGRIMHVSPRLSPTRLARDAAVVIFAAARLAWALGDVQASVADGKLTIAGDDGPNSIQLTAGAGPGAFVVSGLDGTAVNGAASAAVTGVRKVRIDMQGGDDRVELLQVDVDGSLSVRLGAGRDTFLLEDGRVRGRAEVRGGGDDDDIAVRMGTRIGGKLVLRTGKASDSIKVVNASIGGGLEVASGDGADDVTMQFSTIDPDHESLIRTADGNDRVDLLGVDFSDDVELDLGDGNDDAIVEDCDFDGEVFVTGGDGHDELDLEGGNTFDPGERRRFVDFEDFD